MLPSKDGVGASCIALPPGNWLTILDFLTERFPAIGKSEWIARMQRGEVLTAQEISITPQQVYQAHIKIYYYRSIANEKPIPFQEEILFKDDYLVAVDKPHFVPVVPTGRYLQETLLVRVKRKLGIETLAPMHRIDRETAGLVLFTIQPKTRNAYQSLFREKKVKKIYHAIAPFNATLNFPLSYRCRLVESKNFMQMIEEEGEPNAETKIELAHIKNDLAYYILHPVTGQKHQLRVQMSALGIPLLNDRIYPELLLRPDIENDFSHPLKLLAKLIEFIDPITGKRRQFESKQQLNFD